MIAELMDDLVQRLACELVEHLEVEQIKNPIQIQTAIKISGFRKYYFCSSSLKLNLILSPHNLAPIFWKFYVLFYPLYSNIS